MYIENFWGGRGSSKYYHGYIEGGGGVKVLKIYYVVCDWSLMENESLFHDTTRQRSGVE